MGEERREMGRLELKWGWTFRKHMVCKKNRGAVIHGELTRGFQARALTRDAHVRTKPGGVFKIFLPFVVKFFPLQQLKINLKGLETQHSGEGFASMREATSSSPE